MILWWKSQLPKICGTWNPKLSFKTNSHIQNLKIMTPDECWNSEIKREFKREHKASLININNLVCFFLHLMTQSQQHAPFGELPSNLLNICDWWNQYPNKRLSTSPVTAQRSRPATFPSFLSPCQSQQEAKVLVSCANQFTEVSLQCIGIVASFKFQFPKPLG